MMNPIVLDADLQLLLESLRPLLGETANRAVLRMIREASSYRHHAPEELRPVVYGNLEASLSDVGATSDEQRVVFREAGRVRALQGVSVDDMLHGWRIGLDELRASARTQAYALGLPDSVILAFTDRCLAWADRGMLESTAEHRRTELDLVRREMHVRANLVRELLLGALGPSELRIQALAFGLDLGAIYTPFRVSIAGHVDVRAAERALMVADGAGPRYGLAALIDGDLAGFTARMPETVDGFVAGIGPGAPLDALAHPFTLASRALDAALAAALTGLVRFDRLGAIPAVLADDDVGRALEHAILRPLRAAGAAGEVILETVRRYLANDRRLGATAAELNTHVNTIRNRLARFEQLTGRDLHRTDDLVETWWVLKRSP
jgi:hypothetical protein